MNVDYFVLFSSRVRLGLGLGLDSVSGCAHVSVLLSIVIVTLPEIYTCLQLFVEHDSPCMLLACLLRENV